MAGNRHYIAMVVFLAGAAALAAATLTSLPDFLSSGGIQKALTDLDAGRFEQAEKHAVALATDPEHPAARAWAIVAAARHRRGQYASASRAYRLFLASADTQRMRQYALDQIEACRRATEPRPPQTPAPPSKRLDAEQRERLGEVHDRQYVESSEHFVVRARNPELAKLVAGEAEVALDRICHVILAGQDYPHTVTIRIWADHDSYRAHATDAPEWSGGSFRLISNDGILNRRIDLTQRNVEGEFATIMVDRVLPHEMCHLVLQEFFGDATCPLFLNEGLAMMAESSADTGRVELAGKTVAGRARTSLEALLVARRYNMDEPRSFYAMSFSFVEFLHGRMTPRQFREFLLHVKGGCTVADALQRSLYLPARDGFLPAVASAWEDHAVEQSQFVEALALTDPARD